MNGETSGATESQADAGTQPPAGDAKVQAADAGESPEPMSLEEAKKLRHEASTLRRRLRELEEASTTAAEGRLSEQEKLVKQARREGAAEVLTKVNDRLRRSAVKSELAAAGVNVELLDLAMNDERLVALDVDEDGDVQGLVAAMAALKKARPSLFITPMKGAGSADAGARGTPGVPDSNALLRAAIRGR